jgi:hypothetical protein
VGTILYAVSIGPLSQALLPPLIVQPFAGPDRTGEVSEAPIRGT